MRNAAICPIAALLALLLAQPGHAVDCDMSAAFAQKDGNAPGGVTAVWADPAGRSLLFVDRLNVNTDGTRRSYSVDDFWGERVALNNLCNAMSDGCAGLDNAGLKARRELTQRAAAEGWPAPLLAQTKIAASIIPFKGGKPCPAVNGFLVSATALHKPQVADACDITNYADALVTPAIVLPKNPAQGVLSGFAQRGARVGDLVVAFLRDKPEPVFAVVGDTGPAGELGEGSVALNGRLLGKTAEPVNYQELRGKGVFKGKAWVTPPTVVIVFPGTRNAADPWMTPERIEAAARPLFEKWGGIARAQSCSKSYGG
jgi:hypothetical protein